MLITNYNLTLLQPSSIRLDWTGTANYYTWIFINGSPKNSPMDFGAETTRSVTMQVPDLFHVEIHEAATAAEIDRAIATTFVNRPLLVWSPRSGAVKYKAYHKQNAAADEHLLFNQLQDANATIYNVRIGDNIYVSEGAQWNWFRIEAESAAGKLSARDPWPYFVAGLPDKLTDAVMTGTSPNLILTLTA